eukprot:m.719175 g.719175  ORF g.719175 m.719175 type:complete len:734 (+) comp58810_c0_seq22:1091-3292(+)
MARTTTEEASMHPLFCDQASYEIVPSSLHRQSLGGSEVEDEPASAAATVDAEEETEEKEEEDIDVAVAVAATDDVNDDNASAIPQPDANIRRPLSLFRSDSDSDDEVLPANVDDGMHNRGPLSERQALMQSILRGARQLRHVPEPQEPPLLNQADELELAIAGRARKALAEQDEKSASRIKAMVGVIEALLRQVDTGLLRIADLQEVHADATRLEDELRHQQHFDRLLAANQWPHATMHDLGVVVRTVSILQTAEREARKIIDALKSARAHFPVFEAERVLGMIVRAMEQFDYPVFQSTIQSLKLEAALDQVISALKTASVALVAIYLQKAEEVVKELMDGTVRSVFDVSSKSNRAYDMSEHAAKCITSVRLQGIPQASEFLPRCAKIKAHLRENHGASVGIQQRIGHWDTPQKVVLQSSARKQQQRDSAALLEQIADLISQESSQEADTQFETTLQGLLQDVREQRCKIGENGIVLFRFCIEASHVPATRILLSTSWLAETPAAQARRDFAWMSECVLKSNFVILQALLENGLRIDARQSESGTCLHVAARQGNLSAMAWLLSAGADPLQRNSSNRTALQLLALRDFAPEAREPADPSLPTSIVDMSSYVNNPLFSDFKLSLADGTSFFAHRSLGLSKDLRLRCRFLTVWTGVLCYVPGSFCAPNRNTFAICFKMSDGSPTPPILRNWLALPGHARWSFWNSFIPGSADIHAKTCSWAVTCWELLRSIVSEA